MIPDHSIFSPDFKAVLMRKNEEVEVVVDKDSFLTGYVEGRKYPFRILPNPLLSFLNSKNR